MKINSSILAAALGLASVSLASATQYVYVTGSTAARDAVYNTIMAGQGGLSAPEFVGYGSTTPGNCSYMAFVGNIGGTPTIVKCHWSGSEAGIADVTSGGPQESFMADPGTGGIPAATGTATGISGNPPATVTANVNVAQADNDLAYSKKPTSDAANYPDSLVIPFVFVKTTTTITDQAAFTDVTDDGFYALATGGDKLALFTGNGADVNNYVYLAGRDSNSGTRVNAFGDTGYGIAKGCSQIELSSGAMVNFGGATPYYTTEGQSSGGTLAGSLVNTTTSHDAIHNLTGFIAVAYLGLADDATAEGSPNNATRLTFNGVSYTVANVENGYYSFWGYEFTMVNASDDGSGDASDTVAQALVANLQSNTSGLEIPQSLMQAKRSGPTGHPYHL